VREAEADSAATTSSAQKLLPCTTTLGAKKPSKTRVQLPTPVKVLLADGHQLLANALSVVLRSDPVIDVIGVETEPNLVLARIGQCKPNVLLLSYFFMRYKSGRITDSARVEFPDLRIIVLTSSADDDTITACIRHGAAAYVNKDRPPEELIHVIKQVYAGEVLFPPDVLMKLLNQTLREQQIGSKSGPAQPLAPRELQVLQALAQGMSTQEIAAELKITVHTARTHLKNIMIKLNAHTKLEAVVAGLKDRLIDLPR
jgi:DNA-binding NarL/FixJ family response regulator